MTLKRRSIIAFLLVCAMFFVVMPQFSHASAQPKVAKVYILANPSGPGSSTSIDDLGHAFLAVLNKSKSSITVGKYKLSPGAFLTVGTWGNKNDADSCYYNVEKYRMINTKCKYKPNVYLSKNITKKQLSKLSSTINNNCFWSLNRNCAYFARICWNAAVGKNSKLRIKAAVIETPSSLHKKIKRKNSYKANFTFSKNRTCAMKYVYVQLPGGLKHVSKKTQEDVKNP